MGRVIRLRTAPPTDLLGGRRPGDDPASCVTSPSRGWTDPPTGAAPGVKRRRLLAARRLAQVRDQRVELVGRAGRRRSAASRSADSPRRSSLFGSTIDSLMNAGDSPFSAPSRSGPVVPVEPAAASVWQPEHRLVLEHLRAVGGGGRRLGGRGLLRGAPLPASSSASAVSPASSFAATSSASSASWCCLLVLGVAPGEGHRRAHEDRDRERAADQDPARGRELLEPQAGEGDDQGDDHQGDPEDVEDRLVHARGIR